jgi:hypothetical protein
MSSFNSKPTIEKTHDSIMKNDRPPTMDNTSELDNEELTKGGKHRHRKSNQASNRAPKRSTSRKRSGKARSKSRSKSRRSRSKRSKSRSKK